jgi:nuclear transport factor 2 (NTF2) superfamily protein
MKWWNKNMIKIALSVNTVVKCQRCRGVKNFNEAPAMGGMNHSMMDHGAMVTSEEAFVVNMIPHHQEAVDTARLVLAKGESAELKKLAQAIITAQEKEIAMMQKWSKDWNYSTVKSELSEYDGWWDKALRESSRYMVPPGDDHASYEQSRWQNHFLKLDARKEVSDFAREVIRVQSSEISQMKLMLGERYDDASLHAQIVIILPPLMKYLSLLLVSLVLASCGTVMKSDTPPAPTASAEVKKGATVTEVFGDVSDRVVATEVVTGRPEGILRETKK